MIYRLIFPCKHFHIRTLQNICKNRTLLTRPHTSQTNKNQIKEVLKDYDSPKPTIDVTVTTDHINRDEEAESVKSSEDEVSDFEEMFIPGPAGLEWGGPTRGGRRPEPTRYGDWERSGRVSDF